MAIERDIRDNKIQRNLAGEVLSSSAVESSEMLRIDKDLQIPNRIHKNDINEVSQITDKAQNIAFVGSCGYDYDNGFTFDGVADYLTANKSIEAISGDFFFGAWVKLTATLVGNNFICGADLSTNRAFHVYFSSNGKLNVSLDGGVLFSTSGMVPYVSDEFNFFSFERKGSNVTISVNGFPDNKVINISDLDCKGNFLQLGNTGGINNQPLEGSIKYLVIRKNNPYDSYNTPYGEQAFVPKQAFNYCRRYKTGESYISNKFLKDAVIDVNNRIERIYNSIKDTYFEQTILANRPRRTNGGIEYLNGESLTQSISDEYAYGTADFFIGRWVDFKNESVVFSIGGIIKIGIDSTNIYAETSGGKLYATRQNSINEGFKYIGFHRENGTVYLSVKGYYEKSRVENINYSASQSATIGGTFIGTDTDMYNIKESFVSFVGEVLGNKVFEPPKRGGFNSDILMYDTVIIENLGYGYIYNSYIMGDVNFPPNDWKVANYPDYDSLINFVGDNNTAGGFLKQTGTEYWDSPNTGATDDYGFSVRGCGVRYSDGTFYGLKIVARMSSGLAVYYPLLGFYNSTFADAYVGTNHECGGVRMIYTGAGTPPSIILDNDGNAYDVIQINNQYWTKQNWRCTTLNNGTLIPNVTDNTAWSNAISSSNARCAYNNDESNV